VLFLWWYLLFGSRFADELCKAFSGEAVFGRSDAINEALTSNVRTVQKFVDIHYEKNTPSDRPDAKKCRIYDPQQIITPNVKC